MATILCADDDQYLTDLLHYALAREGFTVRLAHTGRDVLHVVRSTTVELIVLDVNLPDISGFRVLSTLRTFTRVPVILLTARSAEEDVVTGFAQGADDYVPKPFSVQVLLTRIRAVLRRTALPAEQPPDGNAIYRLAGILFDAARHEMVSEAQRVRLTPTESRILALLIQHAGQVLSAQCILERVCGYNSESDPNVIKTHIRHLRKKLGSLPHQPQPIHTLPGVGYVVPQAEAQAAVMAAPPRGAAQRGALVSA